MPHVSAIVAIELESNLVLAAAWLVTEQIDVASLYGVKREQPGQMHMCRQLHSLHPWRAIRLAQMQSVVCCIECVCLCHGITMQRAMHDIVCLHKSVTHFLSHDRLAWLVKTHM